MKRFVSILLYIPLVYALVAPTVGNAQIPQPAAPSSVLVLSPRYPEPGEQVTVSLNDYSINTAGAQIQWFIDGSEIVEAKNERSINVTAGTLGSTMRIQTITTLTNGVQIPIQVDITPVRVDMLIEANTLTPPFYRGRSVPAEGSTVQVTAIPFVGDSSNPESFSYTWRVQDRVIGGGSRFGKNSITFSSGFGKNILVSVDIYDTKGTLVTSDSIVVPLVKPELYFYEVNPLRGVIPLAIQDRFIFVGDEIRVRAEPYFLDASLLSQNPFIEWKLDNRTVQNPSADPQEITLRKEGDRGSFTLEFHIRNLRQLLQGIKKSVTISF